MTMIEAGLVTPYDLKEAAGVSVGASLPALARLEKDHWVRYVTVGRRHEYSLTAEGRHWLKSNWKKELDEFVPTEFDSVLRHGFLRWFWGDQEDACRFFQAASKARQSRLQERKTAAERLLAGFQTGCKPDALLWMRKVTEVARSSTDAATLRLIARILAKKAPA